MTDKSPAKSYLKQYFGTQCYLYQDGLNVPHLLFITGLYYLHGNSSIKFSH
ncbi:hypothetical protein DV953_12945 [Staphylococcus pseudintermedius]|uniref:SAV1978 family virulence-associated passenger protein n=1 Tax=Staphylococcus pseudintermedius TaxID=283734 RepID=UPI000E22C862|nr:SAV1978 family virulence-associated passenger protein [Staphylococcus pseudintermedius]REA94934.1 hypothetical protein DV953_12945 [Staphylococcus pseudintermedius]